MTSAAASARLVATACAVALVAALLVASRADGASRSWNAYLAPAGTCAGEADTHASRAAQARSLNCLVNWARKQDGRRALHQRSALRRAAAIKGRVVAECGQFSHTPCGTDASAAVRQAGYRYALFGENLYAGPWDAVAPRDVVVAWLRSPSHRANLLSSAYRHVGLAPARAPGLLGAGDSVVWTAAFASPS